VMPAVRGASALQCPTRVRTNRAGSSGLMRRETREAIFPELCGVGIEYSLRLVDMTADKLPLLSRQ
ncbi:MAG: hypothetical protein ACTHKH_23165, partial [Trinickia sp.]